MRFFDFIEQQYGVRLLGDRFGQQAALVETNVARRRADQARHGVTLHVLGHVEADQLDAEDEGQLLGHLGLADAGRTGEQEGADRLVGLAQAGARHLDGRGQRFDGRVLAEHHVAQVAVDGLQLAAVVLVDGLRRDAGDLGDDVLDLGLADGFLLLRFRQDALRRAGFVDDVDGLVGQVAVVDEAGRQFSRRRQRRLRVLDAVVLLEARLQAAQDLHGLLDGRLVDVHFLEAARQRVVFFEHAAEFRVRGRAYAFQLAIGQGGLEQIGRVQRAARRRTGADDGMDFVDEQDAVRVVFQLLEDGLEALLEIAGYLVPASSAPMSSENTTAFARISGTSPWVMRQARPSAMAVLPTPASPTSSGLFLRRRHRIWITRSTSSSRPISGSILPSAADLFRFCVNWSSGLSLAWPSAPGAPSSTPSDAFALSACWSLRTPCEMKFTTSRRVTPCWCR